MTRTDVLRMVKRRAAAAGLRSSTCYHTFRATGITAYLENGGTIENAQLIAAHEWGCQVPSESFRRRIGALAYRSGL